MSGLSDYNKVVEIRDGKEVTVMSKPASPPVPLDLELAGTQRFMGIDVRVLKKRGTDDLWFIADEACDRAGIANHHNVVASLDDDEKGLHNMETLGGMQAVSVISEPGLYRVLAKSRKQSAKKFDRWVRHEVLPAIRKTGTYTIDPVAAQSHLLMRHVRNQPKIVPGTFSILQEMMPILEGPLSGQGYSFRSGLHPDISLGRGFCKHLREKFGEDTDAFKTYDHEYLDGRVTPDARLYPDKYLAEFRSWFIEWVNGAGREYFKRKDPESIPYLDKIPAVAMIGASA